MTRVAPEPSKTAPDVVASISTIKALSPQTRRATDTQRGLAARQNLTGPMAPALTISLALPRADAIEGAAIHATVRQAPKKSLRCILFPCDRDKVPENLNEPSIFPTLAACSRVGIRAVNRLAGMIAPMPNNQETNPLHHG